MVSPESVSILCADWSGHASKRSAWQLAANDSKVVPSAIRGALSLEKLLDYAGTLPGPCILAIDAAIGLPGHVVDEFSQRIRKRKR